MFTTNVMDIVEGKLEIAISIKVRQPHPTRTLAEGEIQACAIDLHGLPWESICPDLIHSLLCRAEEIVIVEKGKKEDERDESES